MMGDIITALGTGGGLALISSGHCALMCGPVSLASRARGGAHAVLLYGGGRLVSYTMLGAIAGSLGRVLAASPWTRWAEAGFSWLLAMMLFHAGLRMFASSRTGARERGLLQLRRRPRRAGVTRVLVRLADEPLLLGAATALLPCGALIAALSASAALGSAVLGSLAMATFAVLTGVALGAFGELGGIAPGYRWRRLLGGVLLAGALLMALRPIPTLRTNADGGSAAPNCHAHLGAFGAEGAR